MNQITANETLIATEAHRLAIYDNRQFSLISYIVKNRQIIRQVEYAVFPLYPFEIYKVMR